MPTSYIINIKVYFDFWLLINPSVTMETCLKQQYCHTTRKITLYPFENRKKEKAGKYKRKIFW